MQLSRLQQYSALITCSGDGMYSECVNGLLLRSDQYKLPIGIIPLGTGNSYMHDLNCLDIEQSVMNIIHGNTYSVDINLLHDENQLHLYSINTVGFGIVAESATVAENHRYLGVHRYNVCAIWILLKAISHHLISTYNSTVVSSSKMNLAFANQTQYFGHGLRSCPYAKLNDGLLDVVYLINASRIDMLKLFLLMPTGQHTIHKCVRYQQVEQVTFHDVNQSINVITVDGENVIYQGKLTIKCIPAAIDIFA